MRLVSHGEAVKHQTKERFLPCTLQEETRNLLSALWATGPFPHTTQTHSKGGVYTIEQNKIYLIPLKLH